MRLELFNCTSEEFEDYLNALFKNVEILEKSLSLFNSMCTHIQTNTTEVQHLKDQSLDYETSMAYLSPSISCLSLLCCLLSKSIRKYGWNRHLGNDRHGVLIDRLTTIIDMFHVNCRLILSFLRYVYGYPIQISLVKKIFFKCLVYLYFYLILYLHLNSTEK